MQEVSELQAGELEKTNEHSDSINPLNKNTDRFKKSHPPSNKIKTEQGCFYCGSSYPHPGGKTSYPAFGRECRGCGRIGHFKEVCRAKHTGRSGSFSSNRRELPSNHHMNKGVPNPLPRSLVTVKPTTNMSLLWNQKPMWSTILQL